MKNMNKAPQLVLWDVDGTLLDTHWTDKIAMSEAGRDLAGREFDISGVDMAGTLDPNIWRDIARVNGIADADAREEQYRQAYLARLQAREAAAPAIQSLPGTKTLLAHLAEIDGITQGVLSGNYPEIGLCKLQSAGIDAGFFRVFAWGSDGQVRRDLFPVAFERFQTLSSQPVDPKRTVVIGDTPRDIECAHEFGCRMLAAATGKFSVQQLTEAGADLVTSDLTETEILTDWIMHYQ